MKQLSSSHILLLAVAIIVPAFSGAALAGDTETLLFTFQGGAYGRGPGSFVRDASGNIYGALAVGGNSTCEVNCGVVYKLSPGANGHMVETIAHTFTGGNDGAQPNFVLMDSKGNLFVSARAGGSTKCLQGCGAVVELSPLSGGGYATTVLYDFAGGVGGDHPNLNFMDSQGNLYGSANAGPWGEIFELSPSSSGTWTKKALYTFKGGSDGGDGSPLYMDASGNIFGTAEFGGNTACTDGCGVVFELTPNSTGTWTESVLYTFAGAPNDGAFPGALIPDGTGNIFGATSYGGDGTNSVCVKNNPLGCGTLFELSPSSGGGYTETVLHSFNNALDGENPGGPLFLDSTGNLYVALAFGGVGSGGVVLEFTLGSDGIWEDTTLHSFANGKSGGVPTIFQLDSSGNVFGETDLGGANDDGVVFELSPAAESH